jgi:tetratricopeptide (TPR) repeat protein
MAIMEQPISQQVWSDEEFAQRLMTLSGSEEFNRLLRYRRGRVSTAVIRRLKDEVAHLIRADIHRAVKVADVTRAAAALCDDPMGMALAHHAGALAMHFSGRYAEAVEFYEQAQKIYLTLGREVEAARIVRATIDALMYLGRYDDAVAAFAAAQGLGGVDHTGFPAQEASRLANLHAELAEAYIEAGGVTDAIEQYAKAAKLRPEFLDLRHRLARLRLDAGDAALARSELEAIVELRPSFVEARAALGMACYLLGDTAAARTAWERCRTERPDDARITAYLALLARVGS